MGRLINYGAGEIVDRLTILALKILYGEQAGRETKHFRDERNALLTKLHALDQYQSWYELGLELGAVNAALWQAEDELRGYRRQEEHDTQTAWPQGVPVVPCVTCAFRIQTLNDRRSDLIKQINQKTGEHLGEEKVTG